MTNWVRKSNTKPTAIEWMQAVLILEVATIVALVIMVVNPNG